MAKALCSMTREERLKAIARRLASKERGLGYWAAVDAQKQEAKVKEVPAEVVEVAK